MKKLLLIALIVSSFSATALVTAKANPITSGKSVDFKTLADITDDKVVCLFVKNRYMPLTKEALKRAGAGKSCRSLGYVGVDYIGINKSSRNKHLFSQAIAEYTGVSAK